MITELKQDLDRSLRREFATPADDARVQRTAAALEANGMQALRAADAADAKRIVMGLIPDGSQVHHGASQSLEISGIREEIEKPAVSSHSGPASGAWTARLRATRSVV